MSEDEKDYAVVYSEGDPGTLRRGWWWKRGHELHGPFLTADDAEEDAQPGRGVDPPTPDDTAAPDFPPYTYGERRRNPYYLALHEIRRRSLHHDADVMISKDADVTDIIHAFGLDYDLGEVVAKICRLRRKAGTNIRQEFIKMHEHIQAAEDAWVAEED